MRIIAMLAALFASAPAAEYPPAPANPASVLDFTLTDNAGKPYPLAQHRGQVLLIVNVASRCGFTKQYAGLQALSAKHQAQGLVVIGVPANDFLRQEPGTDAEIAQFCSTKFGVTFPLMAKTVVKGDGITPLYAFLTTKGPEPGAISWNFNKYLIGRDGVAKARFGSRTAPDDEALVQAIERELALK